MTPDKRLEAFRKMVEQRPDEPFARYSLAMAYRSAGRAADAAREFEELLSRTPDYVPAYIMAGQMLEATGRGADAEQLYERGIGEAGRKGDVHAGRELRKALDALRARRES